MSDQSDQSPLSQPDPSPFSESGPSSPPQAAFAPPLQPQPQPTNTPGLVGFILSLTGLIAPCMFPVGLIVSLFGLGKEPKGLAIAGLIIGAIGTVLLLLIFVVYGAMIAACVGVASTMQPMMDTQTAIGEASSQIDDYYYENEELPDEATGNSLISGITDGWEKNLRYELDEDAFDGYLIRSAGPDGVFDTEDDSTSEDSFGEDWDEYELDDLDWGESDADDSSIEIEFEEGGTEAAEEVESAEEVIVE